MKEGTAGRSLKGKMLPRAKHMGLLENITAVKDRLSDWCRQRWRQYRTWSKKKKLPTGQPLHKNGRKQRQDHTVLVPSGLADS